MTVSLSNGITTVVVADYVAAALNRPLRRTDLDVMNTPGYQINYGTPGKLSGTITYLCDTYANAQALDALYSGTSKLTLATGTGNALNGLLHVAVGQLRLTAERALPGLPARWTLQADIREVTP